MSRTKYIQKRVQAKKRKLLFMRAGLMTTALCVALFVFIPDATSGTSDFVEREIPEEKPEEQQELIQSAQLEVPDISMTDSSTTVAPDSLENTQTEIADASIAEATEEQSTTEIDPKPDVEGGSRSPIREEKPDTESQNTTEETSSTQSPVRFESPEAVLGAPKPKVEEAPTVPAANYMKMPDYKSATLKYKLGLIGSDAYSPSEKEKLYQHIISMFPANAQVDAVYLESNGQQFSKSYPIKLYLLRLEQNPSIRIRSVEQLREGGKLSGLTVKE